VQSNYRGIRYWPTWLGIGCLYLLAKLPYPTLQRLGGALGSALFSLMRSRRKVALTNLAIAYPDATPAALQEIARESFRHTAMSITETAACW